MLGNDWYWLAHRNVSLPTVTIVLEIIPIKILRTFAKSNGKVIVSYY